MRTAWFANIVAVRCAGGMLAKSRAMLAAFAITWPRLTPALSCAAFAVVPTRVTEDNFGALLSTVFRSV